MKIRKRAYLPILMFLFGLEGREIPFVAVS